MHADRTTSDLYADEIRAARLAIRRLRDLGSLTIAGRVEARLDRVIEAGDDVGVENACDDAIALAAARLYALVAA